MKTLILASTSAYRKQLLERFALSFEIARPETDETPLAGERPDELAVRLAIAKAKAIADCRPHALVIGSDQVACIDSEIFGKPGTVERAHAQLQRMSGQDVVFHTAVAVIDSDSGRVQSALVPTHVRFRSLTRDEIERYVAAELPLDCAGSAKSEGLGITLLDALSGDDPTALIGLPLIALSRMLRNEGLALP